MWSAWDSFGPLPPEPPPTPEELYAKEFAREFERQDDPRQMQQSDNLRRCSDDGDWEGAVAALEEMWKCGLDPDSWSYGAAIDACLKANETDVAEKLQREVQSWGMFPEIKRFQMTPVCRWQRQLKNAGAGIHNTLDWKGRHPVPTTDHPCWLLPAQDDAAEHISEYELELRQSGWKVLTCDHDVVARLRSKDALHEYANSLGLKDMMPERYSSPAAATYPCILKPARGTWGKNTHVVYGSEEVLRMTRPGKMYEVERQVEQQAEYLASYSEQWGKERDLEEDWAERADKVEEAVRNWVEQAEWEDITSDWVLEELLVGQYEYSTSLLVEDGEILDYACSRYNFSSEVYVWPALEYDGSEYVSVPEGHLATMRSMLAGFTGICNFNYKLRPCGKICIFEVNPRVGGDLVFDVPKPRVRALFEKLDAMLS